MVMNVINPLLVLSLMNSPTEDAPSWFPMHNFVPDLNGS